MKSSLQFKNIIRGSFGMLLLAVGLAMATTVKADESSPAVPSSAASTVSGTVSAKSDMSLTVGSTTVTVTETTAIMKGGESIELDGVNVGDEVKVTAHHADDGSMAAVSIEVVEKETAEEME